MRTSRRVPMLAAVVTLAGVSAQPAYAFKAGPISGAPPTTALEQQHHPSSSTDWGLVGVAAAGITVVGVSLGASRRLGVGRPQGPRAAGGS